MVPVFFRKPLISRASGSPAVLGDYVFEVDGGAQTTPDWVAPFFQSVTALPPTAGEMKAYTLGGWMWADQSTSVSTPSLGDGYRVHKEDVQIGVEPTFQAITITINPQKGMRLWVGLDPNPSLPNTTVYYDGLVLVEGNRSVTIPPVFSDSRGESGTWAGEPFRNLLRNASAERAGIRVAPWVDDLGARILPDQSRPSLLVSYILDWQGAGWSYRLSLERIMRTFWAAFGWGHVYLLGSKPYRWLAIVSIFGVIGAVIWFTRRLIWARDKIQWDIIALFGLLLVGSWGSTLTRAAVFLGNLRLYLPVARYAYPAIIPTVTLLWLGWLELFKPLGKRIKSDPPQPIHVNRFMDHRLDRTGYLFFNQHSIILWKVTNMRFAILLPIALVLISFSACSKQPAPEVVDITNTPPVTATREPTVSTVASATRTPAPQPSLTPTLKVIPPLQPFLGIHVNSMDKAEQAELFRGSGAAWSRRDYAQWEKIEPVNSSPAKL